MARTAGQEFDSLADKMMATEDYKKQLEIATELEKRHLAEVAIYIPVSNGPNYQACKKGLANYGPRLLLLHMTRMYGLTLVGRSSL